MSNKRLENAALILFEVDKRKCIDLCTSAIIQYENDPFFYELRAKSSYIIHDYDNAYNDYSWIFNYYKDNWESAYYLGMINLKIRNNIEHSIMFFEHLVYMSPALARGEVYNSLKFEIEGVLEKLFVDLDDVVKLFKLNFHKVSYHFYSVGTVIAETLDSFKETANREIVYKIFCSYLIDIMLPYENEYGTKAISKAIIVLQMRLRQFDIVIKQIEKIGFQDEFFINYWLKSINMCDEIQTLNDNEEKFYEKWKLLGDIYSKKFNNLGSIGRMYYPMIFYLNNRHKRQMERFFNKTVFLIFRINYLITEIKELLNVNLELLKLSSTPKLYQYMSREKFFRVFKDREKTTWQLTCADHMNDKLEGSALYKYISQRGFKEFDTLINTYGNIKDSVRSDVFLLSFSLVKNADDMYEKYATDKNGKRGVCVEFSMDAFDDIIEDEQIFDEYYWICPLYSVVYADSIGDISRDDIRQKLDFIVKDLALINSYWNDLLPSKQKLRKEFLASIYRMLQEISYLFKTRTGIDTKGIVQNWQQESEFRIMKCVRASDDNIKLSDTLDGQGKCYRSYMTKKLIKVSEIFGASEDQAIYEEHLKL